MKALHVTEIRDLVLSNLTEVPNLHQQEFNDDNDISSDESDDNIPNLESDYNNLSEYDESESVYDLSEHNESDDNELLGESEYDGSLPGLEPAMQSVYGSLLLPYISSHHVALQYRLFEHSHICHSPAHPSSLGVYHLPLTSTL